MSMRRGFVFLLTLAVVLAVAAVAAALAAQVSARSRAVDAQAARAEVREAVIGMARAVAADLTHTWKSGKMPALAQVAADGHAVGGCVVFLLDHRTDAQGAPTFGLRPASARLHCDMVAQTAALPGMSKERADAIKAALPRHLADLRLLEGFDDDLVLGEDANANGLLDDGEDLDRDGRLRAGLRDWLWLDGITTPAGMTAPDGSAAIPAAQLDGKAQNTLVTLFGRDRAVAICAGVDPRITSENIGKRTVRPRATSRLHLLTVLKLSEEEAAALWPYLADPTPTDTGGYRWAEVDPFLASDEVLAAVFGPDLAVRLKAARPSTPPASPLWAAAVLTPDELATYGPFMTTGSFAFEADILAVRADAGGFARMRAVIAFGNLGPAQVRMIEPGGEAWPFPAAPLDRFRRQVAGTDAFSSPLPLLLPQQATQGPPSP